MPPLLLYEPIDTLKPVAEAIWIADGPLIRFRYCGLRLPFTTRMTLIRLQDGALWLHSPIALKPSLHAQVDVLGRVTHLVSPNTIHYAYLPEWQRAYPNALSYGVPGVLARAHRNGVALRLDRTLGAAPEPTWAAEIDSLLVAGSLLTEAVFFHRPSRTLILTDLIENFEPGRIRNPLYRLLVRLSGAMDPDGKAPRDMQLSFSGHRGELHAAVRTMIGWAPERVLLAHGRWYDRNGTAELRRAFRWLGRSAGSTPPASGA